MLKIGDGVYINNKNYPYPYYVYRIDGAYATLIAEEESRTFKVIVPINELITVKGKIFHAQLYSLISEGTS